MSLKSSTSSSNMFSSGLNHPTSFPQDVMPMQNEVARADIARSPREFVDRVWGYVREYEYEINASDVKDYLRKLIPTPMLADMSVSVATDGGAFAKDIFMTQFNIEKAITDALHRLLALRTPAALERLNSHDSFYDALFEYTELKRRWIDDRGAAETAITARNRNEKVISDEQRPQLKKSLQQYAAYLNDFDDYQFG
ncbi:hypothetical protein FQN54_000044 [Arachnomyces sp. PD_36]|nr:hypothetical protein FQN54_000044 [Arachnomyces sp. PD_36]